MAEFTIRIRNMKGEVVADYFYDSKEHQRVTWPIEWMNDGHYLGSISIEKEVEKTSKQLRAEEQEKLIQNMSLKIDEMVKAIQKMERRLKRIEGDYYQGHEYKTPIPPMELPGQWEESDFM